MKPEFSIILPVHNQADHIVAVLKLYQKISKSRPWEIVLVPNACRDDSPALCRQFARKNRNIRVVENAAGGWGLSVRVGLQAAKGRFLCYTNSARTDPATIPLLFKKLGKHSEAIVKIRRFARGSFLRGIGSMLYNLECRLLFGVRSHDVNGTPKLFAASILKRVKLVSDGDLLDAELLARCRKLGVPLLETPLAGWSRHGGQSTTKLKSALRMYWGALLLWWSMK